MPLTSSDSWKSPSSTPGRCAEQNDMHAIHTPSLLEFPLSHLHPSPCITQSHFERAGKSTSVPPSLFSFEELVMGKDGELRKEKRFPGTNKVGMLAWHTVLKTPQYPEGREVSTTLPLPCS
jgi:hypothetical protein